MQRAFSLAEQKTVVTMSASEARTTRMEQSFYFHAEDDSTFIVFSLLSNVDAVISVATIALNTSLLKSSVEYLIMERFYSLSLTATTNSNSRL